MKEISHRISILAFTLQNLRKLQKSYTMLKWIPSWTFVRIASNSSFKTPTVNHRYQKVYDPWNKVLASKRAQFHDVDLLPTDQKANAVRWLIKRLVFSDDFSFSFYFLPPISAFSFRARSKPTAAFCIT